MSHHLAALRLMRLVTHRRSGKRVFYRLGQFARLAGPRAFRIECPHFALTFELHDGEARPWTEPEPA